MPELPEVETVKEILKKELLHQTIRKVEVYYDGVIKNTSVEEFKKRLENQKINDIRRYGKYLIFCFDDFYMLSHLRMEGKYYVKKFGEVHSKHEHVEFFFDHFTLRYHDTRKFGTFDIVNKDDLFTESPLKNLGLEAFDDKCDLEYLRAKFLKRKPIKTLLLDQSVIAGIGNIYADEICFAVGLLPTRLGNTLTDNDLLNIKQATISILNDAIKAGGTTIRSYTSQLGVTGMFQQNLNVHTMKNCKKCQTPVEKIKVGGRGTYYCPCCQK